MRILIVAIALFIVVQGCVASAEPSAAAPTAVTPSSAAATRSGARVEQLRVEVIERRAHDPGSYTQGLELDDGRLYESSGYGELREVDPHTGAVIRSIAVDGRYFAEGITVVDDRLIQLTWQQRTALVYRLSDFEQVATFTYDTEGWGLCDDGTRLVMSDGTSRLYFRDRATFSLLGTVDVTNAGAPVEPLNELECVDGKVYANVWRTDEIVRVDPSTGHVTAVIDAGPLVAAEGHGDEEAVLNGIAFDAASGTFLLTGKLWATLFEVRFVPA